MSFHFVSFCFAWLQFNISVSFSFLTECKSIKRGKEEDKKVEIKKGQKEGEKGRV